MKGQIRRGNNGVFRLRRWAVDAVVGPVYTALRGADYLSQYVSRCCPWASSGQEGDLRLRPAWGVVGGIVAERGELSTEMACGFHRSVPRPACWPPRSRSRRISQRVPAVHRGPQPAGRPIDMLHGGGRRARTPMSRRLRGVPKIARRRRGPGYHRGGAASLLSARLGPGAAPPLAPGVPPKLSWAGTTGGLALVRQRHKLRPGFGGVCLELVGPLRREVHARGTPDGVAGPQEDLGVGLASRNRETRHLGSGR